MGLFSNPLGYAGYPPNAGPPANVVNSTVRAATVAEAAAGTLSNVYISPATEASSVALDFASPPVGGFGSTTPRPVHATTLSSLGTTTLNTSGAAVTSINTGGTGALNLGNATGNTAVTGSLTASTGLVATAGGIAATGTSSINISGAAVTSINTGGTGALNLGNATGNTAVTGSLTASTTLTATSGAITATNGNIVKHTAGNKDIYGSVASTIVAGANSAGTVVLVGGTATVATSAITASSIVRMYRQGIGATGATTLGLLTLGTVMAGVSFVINAVETTDATTPQAADVSVIAWEIVN